MHTSFGNITEFFMYVSLGVVLITPLLILNIKVAPKLGLIDWPKARGVADDHIPIVGHSLVLLSVLAIVTLMQLYGLSPWFLTTSLFMAVMGHLDDRKPLPPLDKMFFQLICVATVVFLDPMIREAISVKYGTSGSLWAIFFIVGLVNAVNFIDGIDGLAGLVILLGSLGFIFISRGDSELYPYFAYASLLVGMMFPFLYFNVLKRKGFLGNVGSYFFSYVLAILHLSAPISANSGLSRIALSSLCFLVPVADAALVVVCRIATGRSPFHPDKGHLHHRLLQSNIALRHILLVFGIIETTSISIGYQLVRHNEASLGYLPVFVLASNVVLTAVLILLSDKSSKRRVQAHFQRLSTGEPLYYLKYELKNQDGSFLTASQLRRVEARVGAEIRVTDVCYVEAPAVLFVTLRNLAKVVDPVRGVAARLDAVFQSEKIQSVLVQEVGEFVKVLRTSGLDNQKKTGT